MAKSDASAKSKKDTTKGAKKKVKSGAGAGDGVSVAAHPRAAAQVRRAKGLGGIVFFFLTAYLSYKAAVPLQQVALRAIAGGIAGYLLAWACAVTVWRHLVMAELRAAVESGRARYEAAQADPAAEPATELQPAAAE
jgi:hypothetical protein